VNFYILKTNEIKNLSLLFPDGSRMKHFPDSINKALNDRYYLDVLAVWLVLF
jgi:hypothetical protein